MSQAANILIVDDTPENLTVLRDILVRSGYRVRPVLQGALAVKSAFAEPPDLILLDIVMPGMDGFETCQHLKADARTRDVPVLFISALDATESKLRGFEVGGLDYIIKPFRPEEVLARVRTHLALRAAQLQLQRQNEELVQAAHLREDVDHMLRHDLRGPLSNMISYSELILDETARDSKAAEHACIIANAGYAMLNMIHASFDLMKMERGNYTLKAEPFDLVELVRQIITELEIDAARKKLKFDLTFADPDTADIIVLGERLLSHSLFYNLLKNAIEASPAEQGISFRFAGNPAQAQISLRNAGAVPESIRERFFDKYVTHGKTGGTGLGTFSAKLMAKTQRGSIQLDSSEPGHTTIHVFLPRASAADLEAFRANRAETAAAHSQRAEAMDLPPADFLIADDDGANRAYLEHILPTPPLALHLAANGTEALTILQGQPITAALIDLEMPGMSGLELVRAYRQWYREQQPPRPAAILIAFSGHQDAATRERCLEAGFDRILAKPTAKPKLYEELKRVLALGNAVVSVDRAIQDLIPEFIASQRHQIHDLERLIAGGDNQGVGSLAHKLQGSLAMYGFETASRLATSISDAAKASELEQARALTADLRTHLTSLQIKYI